MKTNFIILFTIFVTKYGITQIAFEQLPPPQPAPQNIADFDGVDHSSIAFADIDGDNDQDVLITGENSSNQPMSKLYTNNGNGSFSEVVGTAFEGVFFSSIAFADIDGDNDQDVLITGVNSSNQRISKLYTNNGNGIFTEVVGTPFDGVGEGSIAFADIDGDNDQDILITGSLSTTTPIIAKLYQNDGNGNFSEVIGTPFEVVSSSSVSFADIDGDNDQDLLITGKNSTYFPSSKLYTNDGNGTFTEVIGTPFVEVYGGSIAFSDIDGDNDQDVLITGYNNSLQQVSKLYTNDGSGSFTEVVGIPFEGVYRSSIAFSDIDGDNDQDVLITGENSSSLRISKLYTNDGNGAFTEVIGTPFEGLSHSSISFSDIDGDNDQDILITGYNNSIQQISKLYNNDGNGSFTEVVGTAFEGVYYSSIAFGDIDSDNDQDALITGKNSLGQPISKLYTNDGNGAFTEVIGIPFEGVSNCSIAFSDIDGDNDLDVLITGKNSSNQQTSKLYTNDGIGAFTEVIGTPFDEVYSGSIAFSDIDGDNDQDVLITGYNTSSQRISKLYTNDGNGSYTEVVGTPFVGVILSSIAFSDIDGDNDQDVLINGRNSSNQQVSKLYTNNGSGAFTEVAGTPFDGVQQSSIAFSDVDGDNDQDVLITGVNVSVQPIAKLYQNDGSGNFSEVTGTLFEGVYNSSIAFSDVDKDNDKDVLITGLNSSYQKITKLYQNDGSGAFTEVAGTPFEDVSEGSIAFSDVDGDNDQDVLITGSSSVQIIAKLYRNLVCNSNPGVDIQTACEPYTWIDGVTYTASNNSATYVLNNSTGCDSTVTLNLTINTIDITTSQTGGINLSANAIGATYQWLDCDNSNTPIAGATNQDFTAVINGNYAVEVTENGCSDTSACINVMSVGLDGLLDIELVEIYPNPSKGAFNIEFDSFNNEIYNVSIFNTVGSKMYSNTINQKRTEIITNNLASGVYLLHIQNKETKQVVRLVIE